MDSPRETDIVYGDKTHEPPAITRAPGSLDSKDIKNDKFGQEPYETEISDEEGRGGDVNALETAEDIVTTIINVEDDPTVNPWTFRMFFIGLCSPLTPPSDAN